MLPMVLIKYIVWHHRRERRKIQSIQRRAAHITITTVIMPVIVGGGCGRRVTTQVLPQESDTMDLSMTMIIIPTLIKMLSVPLCI